MITILIIDDCSKKVAAIKEVILEFPEIQNNIHVASDANNGRRLLEINKYDLLILDLVLPNNFGEDAAPENGIEFLNEIALDPYKKCPYHILGITARPEYISQFNNTFKKHLWYLIEYQQGIEEWKEMLRHKLQYLIDSKQDLNNERNPQYNFEVAIITALAKELQKVLQLDGKWTEKHMGNDSTTYHVGQFNIGDKVIRVVAAATPQMGMCASSTLSMKLIQHFRPQYIIMAGIAAGIKGEVELGDIMIADEVWDAGNGKVKADKTKGRLFLPDPKHKTLNEDIKEILINLKQKRKYLDDIRNKYPSEAPPVALNIHLGPMASVPAVIQSDEAIEEIKAHNRKLLGIEMEAYGVFYSAAHSQSPKPYPISIKSACDFANEEKNDSMQDYAAYTSATFTHRFITEDLKFV